MLARCASEKSPALWGGTRQGRMTSSDLVLPGLEELGLLRVGAESACTSCPARARRPGGGCPAPVLVLPALAEVLDRDRVELLRRLEDAPGLRAVAEEVLAVGVGGDADPDRPLDQPHEVVAGEAVEPHAGDVQHVRGGDPGAAGLVPEGPVLPPGPGDLGVEQVQLARACRGRSARPPSSRCRAAARAASATAFQARASARRRGSGRAARRPGGRAAPRARRRAAAVDVQGQDGGVGREDVEGGQKRRELERRVLGHHDAGGGARGDPELLAGDRPLLGRRVAVPEAVPSLLRRAKLKGP
jgi:hypothetical protein